MNQALFKVLLDVSRQLAESRALAPLLQYAVDVSVDLLDAEYGYLLLTGADGTLNFRVSRASGAVDMPLPQVSQTILDQVIQLGQPVVTADALADPDFSIAASVDSLQLRSVICVPLTLRGRSIGALYLENRSKTQVFTPDDLEPLQYLAANTAVAIENALLNEELESRIARRTAELHRAEQQIIDMAVEQERVQMLARFIQDASHQFRTPLTLITMGLDTIVRKCESDEIRATVERLREQTGLITQLVASLVLLSELDGAFEIDRKPVDLVVLVKSVVERYRTRTGQRQQQVQVVLPDTPARISGDEDLLARAMLAVMDNAVRYTPEGGQITVTVAADGDGCTVGVADSGMGIAADDVPLVFSRFFRADRAGTTHGLGLGLTIAQKVMELHGGRITLNSKPDEGTQVSLMLPK